MTIQAHRTWARFDHAGNCLRVDLHDDGDVQVSIDGTEARRAQCATIEALDLLFVAYDLLVLAHRSGAGGDEVARALAALREEPRLRADALADAQEDTNRWGER